MPLKVQCKYQTIVQTTMDINSYIVDNLTIDRYQYFFAPFHQILLSRPLGGAVSGFLLAFKTLFPREVHPKKNHKKVLLYKPKKNCTKLSGACQVYCCFKLACDVTDIEAYSLIYRTGLLNL
jgi:hypothetical protein